MQRENIKWPPLRTHETHSSKPLWKMCVSRRYDNRITTYLAFVGYFISSKVVSLFVVAAIVIENINEQV